MLGDKNRKTQTKAKRERASRHQVLDTLFETRRPDGLHKRVYGSLKHAILTGALEKGAKLPAEPVLAETYGVSRPVVRQALEELRKEGLTTSMRGSGNFVSGSVETIDANPPSMSADATAGRQLVEDLEFRLAFEPEAAALAALRRDNADLERMENALRKFEDAHSRGAITHHFDYLFHEAIAIATRNKRFIDAIQSLEYHAEDGRIMMRDLLLFRPELHTNAVIDEHYHLLDLIRSRDSDAVKIAMRDHIERGRMRLVQHLDRSD
ncbi:FCD domain-containing protein (plasmid) [Agrobacterium leguminum]|uniref:GntR family transcriptional regulator n=1 Tax=Agrobacterium deltaense NCPPB 1641 TaxID=1183425 RepID=A0A1S7U9T0_9HYPH|nr:MULTISPECIES: FCD domain-containing protein [Agrobacterium]WFS69633.1 FCD domain-containing protein [Agrobacterium leguminum]CVI63627.1 GntR family transcriptional regulator [Agrobacterium deltaense NCPPB 1641]